jgi:hypothetical protein
VCVCVFVLLLDLFPRDSRFLFNPHTLSQVKENLGDS